MIEIVIKKFTELNKSKKLELFNSLACQMSEDDSLIYLFKDGELLVEDRSNINYVNFDKKNISFHKSDGVVLTTSYLSENYADYLEKYKFVKLDRHSFVNTDNIEWYDLSYFSVMFYNKTNLSVAGSWLKKYASTIGANKNIKYSLDYNKLEFKPIL